MSTSLIRLALLSLALTLIALALSLGIVKAINDFLVFAHNIAAYPGFAGFPG